MKKRITPLAMADAVPCYVLCKENDPDAIVQPSYMGYFYGWTRTGQNDPWDWYGIVESIDGIPEIVHIRRLFLCDQDKFEMRIWMDDFKEIVKEINKKYS